MRGQSQKICISIIEGNHCESRIIRSVKCFLSCESNIFVYKMHLFTLILVVLTFQISFTHAKTIKRLIPNQISSQSLVKRSQYKPDIVANSTSSDKIYEDGIFSKKNEAGDYVLTYYGLMLAGAIARSVAATAVHPLNVIKTMLQRRNGQLPPLQWRTLSRGAGSQFIMSIPHGAFNFAVTEVRHSRLLRLLSGVLLSGDCRLMLCC